MIRRYRLYILLKLFLVMMLVFIIQKPLFMLYNHSIDSSVGVGDYLSVMWHGIPLDMTICGYVLVVPLLILTISMYVKMDIRKWLCPYLIVIAALLGIIFIADTVMYGFWQFKLDTTVFLYTDKPADAMASVSTLFVITTFLTGFLFIAIYAVAFIGVLPKGVQVVHTNKWLGLVMLPVAGVLFLMIRGGVGEGTANVSSVYYSSNQYLNHSAVNPAFSMFYSLSHQQNFASEYQFYDDENKIDKLTSGLYNTESVDTEKLIKTDRPNIILLVWEGCGASFTGCLGAEGNTTPNLDQLAKEGVFFTNCYANSFRTDRGLVCINSGWLGLPSASLMKIPEKCEKLPGLARTLASEGYTTSFWYGGDISFTNMSGYLLQNGYQRLFSDKDFSKKESTSKWGAPDDILLDRAIADIQSAKSPFFTSILTLSSHEPWEVPYSRINKEVENSFAYTDDCIGKFVNGLKAKGIWDNTLLIIVPDHGASAQEGRTLASEDVIHIPLVMTGGAIMESKVVDKIMNQSDIVATLLGQLGIDHSEFVFSRDVMSKSYTYPSAINCSRTNFTFCDSTGLSTYDLDASVIINNKEKKEGDASSHRVEVGKAILQTLYRTVSNL